MALEQAQQQFAAATRIGYESRPLNLFYGLSQAGRAIAAGSRLLGQSGGQQWQASGHGLKYDIGAASGVLESPIQQSGGTRDLFSRVSLAIGSPLDFDAIDFAAAMNQLVDYTMAFQDHREPYPRPITDAHIYSTQAGNYPVSLELEIPGFSNQEEMGVAQVRSVLDQYPALRALDIELNDDGSVRWSHNTGRCFVVVPSAEHVRVRDGVANLARAANYRRTPVLLPSAGRSADALSPLMSWWVILYALSMLARYAPSRWTTTLSLADSPIASRIEFLLDSAIDAVPELLYIELDGLSD